LAASNSSSRRSTCAKMTLSQVPLCTRAVWAALRFLELCSYAWRCAVRTLFVIRLARRFYYLEHRS
jgi:hypothetical protein